MTLVPNGKKASKKQVLRNSKGQLMKGSSGNPKGRPPKGYSIAERMREMFTENPEFKDAIIKSMILAATSNKDVTAAKFLASYLDGMPVQKIEIEKPEALKLHNAQTNEVLQKIQEQNAQ